jgi:hypothetical protein
VVLAAALVAALLAGVLVIWPASTLVAELLPVAQTHDSSPDAAINPSDSRAPAPDFVPSTSAQPSAQPNTQPNTQPNAQPSAQPNASARPFGGAAPSTLAALFFRSVLWSALAALGGGLVAWIAARGVLHGGVRWLSAPVLVAMLLPIALPPWLLFAGIWLSVGPGTAIGDFTARADAVGLVRQLTLAAALVAWSAAPTFAVLLACTRTRGGSSERLLLLDGASWRARLAAAWAQDRTALAMGVLATAAFLLAETTAYDLAFVATFGFELRTLDALGAPPQRVVGAALPAIALSAIVATAVWLLARRQRERDSRLLVPAVDTPLDPTTYAHRARHQTPRGSIERRSLILSIGSAGIAIIFVAGPIALFARAAFAAPRAGDFLALHGRALVGALVVALAASLLVAALAIALRVVLAEPPRSIVRRVALAGSALVALASLVPGTVTALAFEAGYNRVGTAFVYDTPLVLVLALATRALVVGAVVALILDAREPRSRRALRALDGPSPRARFAALRPDLALAAGATIPLAFAWSLGELTASGRLVPPGFAWLATDILNAIHYQRPETVLLGASVLIVAGLAAIAGVAAVARAWRGAPVRRVVRVSSAALGFSAVILTCAISMGCERRPPRGADDPIASADAPTLAGREGGAPGEFDAPVVARGLDVAFTFGGTGRGRGQFNGPRVLAHCANTGAFFVIDKDARVQRFDASGAFLNEWTMPAFSTGKPVGATVAPDGLFVVADTHEHRIAAFTPLGELQWTVGSYGQAEGEFIYPTDVAFAPDGRMFVAEYGSNDRIQVFDRERRFVRAFGRSGSGPGEFLRPQALAYDAARDELYVVDVGNHRIQVFTGTGVFVRTFGRTGTAEGEFAYPFAIVLEVDGRPVASVDAGQSPTSNASARRTIVVAEHGNHRVQRLDAISGEVLGVVGGLGTSGGRLKYPWALESAVAGASGEPRFAVCDHGNFRIVVFAFRNGLETRSPEAKNSKSEATE